MQTNNFGELEALREGLALAWRMTDNERTHLHVRGDISVIIKSLTGRANITAPWLQESAKE